MRWRTLAVVSLAVNLVLAAAWLLFGRGSSARSLGNVTGVSQVSSTAAKTNLVVRRQFFTWQEIESSDYPTYIANLRDIGCPDQTIRDIIIADVNSLFSRRRANELVTSEQQWWRSEPDTNVVMVATEKARALEEERRNLLARLLGPNWESGDMLSLPRPTRPGVILDGPILGALPAETKQALQEIHAHSQDRLQAYLEAQLRDGKNIDPAELAKLRQQTRDELARVLAPVQMEEYMLRYSQNANELRTELGQLRYFNASPDEFRAVFRATDPIDQRIQLLTGNDPNTLQGRKALEAERENAIKLALGAKRYEEYRLLQDPLYREAVAAAEQAGTPEAARTIYQINLAAAAEETGITSDTNLTALQRSLALKQLELDQMTANALASGQEPLPPAPPMPPVTPRRTYVMHPGDNLAVVSLLYGVPINAIRQANPRVNLSRLKPGDVINIPPATQLPVSAP